MPTPGTLYLDFDKPVTHDSLLYSCVLKIGAVSSTSVRFEVWRKLPSNRLINVFTDSKWIPADKLGNSGFHFKFYAKAGDLIGLRCSESNPVAYHQLIDSKTNKSPTFLALSAAPTATDADSGVPIEAFKQIPRAYAIHVMGCRFHEGRLLVLNDEWTLSDTGLEQTSDTQIFASNIVNLFSANLPGSKFLIYSTNTHLLSSLLEKTIVGAKLTLVKGLSTPLDIGTLRTYDAIFVGGDKLDNQMLIDYIKSGGSVCLIAGTGSGGSQSEAAQWSKLLSAFGLRLDASYNNIKGTLPVTSPEHPLLAGVKTLYQNLGQTIHLLPDSKASIIMTSGSQGLIAYATVPVLS